MARPLYPTPELIKKAELFKALFCNLYFSELKWFLSNFNIAPKDGVNSLNMGFLVTAYDHEGTDHRNDCKWNLGEINEEDLMLSIEEYYEITKEPFGGEPLYTERDDLMELLFKNDKGNQIILGDHTLRAILTYFNFKLSPDPRRHTMGGVATTFKEYTKNLPKPYNTFWVAVDLQASLRNWKNHTHDPRFAGMELHLYHRYALYTYIGLVYVCRRIWNDANCTTLLEEKKLSKPECIGNYHIPEQTISVNVTSSSNLITNCRIQIGSGKERITKDEKPDPSTQKYTFSVDKAQKYKDLKFKITNGEQTDPFEGSLDYRSWFLSYDIYLPDKITCNSCGTDIDPTSQLILNIFGTHNDEKYREILQEELSKAKEVLIASITRQSEKERDEYKTSFEKMLKDLGDSLTKEECTIEQFRKEVQEANIIVNEKLDNIRNYNVEFSDYIKKEFWKVPSFLSWLFPLICFISSGFGLLLTVLYPLKASLLWLQTETCIIILFFAIILIAITVFSFTFFNSGKGIINKLRRIGKWQWACLAAIIIFMATAYMLLPYKTSKDIIANYDLTKCNNIEENKLVVSFLEDYANDSLKYEEEARIILTDYYLYITGDIDNARRVSLPLLNIEKYPIGSLSAMNVLYQDKDQALSDFVDQYGRVYGEDDPDYCDIKGAMLCDTVWGYRDIDKGVELLKKACEAGSSNAFYNLGYIYSNDESTMESKDTGRKIQRSYYDLYEAIKLLKRVSSEIPIASILLGDIYADLNMVDSAITYYNQAIVSSKDGNNYILGLYKLGILAGKHGVKPNPPLLECNSLGFPTAQMYSSISMDFNEDIMKKKWFGQSKDFCRFMLGKKDHFKAIKWFENAMKKGSKWQLINLGVYQYIPPIVFSYIYIGEEDKANDLLLNYRPKGNFNPVFTKAVASLIGNANTKRDTIKGMQLMHESAEKGCLFAEMFCIYKDGYLKKGIGSDKLHRLDEISKEITFAHVIKSLLLMKNGDLKEAAEAANMAMWKKHPAGAFAFEFMPGDYYDDYNTGITNGVKNMSDEDVRYARKMQETFLRMTWTSKEKSLLMACQLDKNVCKRDSDSYIDRFKFWTDVALANESFGTMILLLNQYCELIDKGFKDNNNKLIDPLLRGIFANLTHFNHLNYPPSYIYYLLNFLKNEKYVPRHYLNQLLNVYGNKEFEYFLKKADGNFPKITLFYPVLEQAIIDDFNLLSEFTYYAGPYAIQIKQRGKDLHFFVNDNRDPWQQMVQESF